PTAIPIEPWPRLALRGRAGERVGWWGDDERAFAHHVGQRVDLDGLVHGGVDQLGLDEQLARRIAHGENERGRFGALLAEHAEKRVAAAGGEVHVDDDERVVAGAHFLHRLFRTLRGVDAEGLVTKAGEQHDAERVVVFEDEDTSFSGGHLPQILFSVDGLRDRRL